MPLIDTLRTAALEVVNSNQRFPAHTLADLERFVLSTGYDGKQPHADTLDLIYVYAANLLNTGGNGVNMDRFGEMVAAALATCITNNRIASVDTANLVQLCLAWRAGPQGRSLLTRGDDQKYINQMRKLAEYGELTKPLQRHLASVAGFIDLLCWKYGGRADAYHASFSNEASLLHPASAVLDRLNELRHLHGIGVATGLNFIKDSQVPRFAAGSLSDMKREPLGWFVKPDKHVMRMMLFITGRIGRVDGEPNDLHGLKDNAAKHFYAAHPADPHFFSYPVRALYAHHPADERGLWQCVFDIHAWAQAEGVVPLEIDRLLYLIGSGRYSDGKISTTQKERYRRLIDALSLGPR